jgi:DNA-directed RNA polymerase subunit omega
MARITVEDCLKKIDSQYDLVLLAKERTSQLNAGDPPLVPANNDKNTVIALREIGEGKVSIKTLRELAINKLRKHQKEIVELEEMNDEHEDNFDRIYKGEISKSGTAILPTKRTKRISEKVHPNYKNLKTKSIDNNEEKQQQEELKSLPTDNTS